MRRSRTSCLTVALVLLSVAIAEARVSHGLSAIFSVDTVTAVDDVADGVPRGVSLTGIFPNPFNPRGTIEFELAAAGTVELAIFDARGRLVRALEQGARSIGRHRAAWDGQDNGGRAAPSGTYFCRLKTPWGAQTMKLALAR